MRVTQNKQEQEEYRKDSLCKIVHEVIFLFIMASDREQATVNTDDVKR